MLLVALLDGQRIDATTLSRASWLELQNSEKRKRLVLPGCGIRAVAKPRGERTQYFAHLSVRECKVDHGGESPQHLAMKEALRDRINAVEGWHAIVEHPHDSREWIIDVLAESDGFRRRVAFEVQLSSQSPAKYQHRSQRYFTDGLFPVWIVPRRPEDNLIRVPLVVTGFGKSSEIPAATGRLMDLDVTCDFREDRTLGTFVDNLLQRGHGWNHGSPNDQAARHKKRTESDARLRDEARRRQEAIDERIEEMNQDSAAPEAAFGAHTVLTEDGPFIWASLSQCWRCEHPMLLWDAEPSTPGRQYLSVPTLDVKREVGTKRYESDAAVHAVLDVWMHAVRADVQKANIKLRRSKKKAAEYSAFVCPECDALIGQMFISCLRPEKWSLISAPLLKKQASTTVPTKPEGRNDPRKGKQQKQRSPVVVPKERPLYKRPTVPEELQADRKKSWAEIHSPDGVAEARRKFMGTAAPYRGN
ncbi:competence protein CoiA [Pseudarthrobacter oxydans]|uniref:competence protein CoiA n=1 Tax=Pseudarthrobacter oxydans TaxID=1671 RepID=UPI00380B5D90